jgi:RimJ/RimL family protein N-acetyltransferase
VTREDGWSFLCGASSDVEFTREVSQAMLSAETLGLAQQTYLLTYHPQDGEALLFRAFHPRIPVLMPRRHYSCNEATFDWRSHVPAGFNVQRMTPPLLDDGSVALPSEVRRTLELWRANESPCFRDYGFAAFDTTVSPVAVVSWATVDGIVEGVGDVGLYTLPEYRGRGLATATTAAALEHGLSSGLVRVEWTCAESNGASSHLAEKLGLVRGADYRLMYLHRDPVLHLCALGYQQLQAGDPTAATASLGQAVALRDDLPSYVYVDAAEAWAQLGATQRSLDLLEQAVQRGWHDVPYLEGSASFAALKHVPRWSAILAQMIAP